MLRRAVVFAILLLGLQVGPAAGAEPMADPDRVLARMFELAEAHEQDGPGAMPEELQASLELALRLSRVQEEVRALQARARAALPPSEGVQYSEALVDWPTPETPRVSLVASARSERTILVAEVWPSDEGDRVELAGDRLLKDDPRQQLLAVWWGYSAARFSRHGGPPYADAGPALFILPETPERPGLVGFFQQRAGTEADDPEASLEALGGLFLDGLGQEDASWEWRWGVRLVHSDSGEPHRIVQPDGDVPWPGIIAWSEAMEVELLVATRAGLWRLEDGEVLWLGPMDRAGRGKRRR